MQKYVVKLSKSQSEELECMPQSGETNLSILIHAYILLMTDCDGPAWPVSKICQTVHISAPTVHHVKRDFVEGGLQRAVYDAKRVFEHKIDEAAIGHLTKIMSRLSPVGHRRWTLRLLKAEMAALGYDVSHETIRAALMRKMCPSGV